MIFLWLFTFSIQTSYYKSDKKHPSISAKVHLLLIKNLLKYIKDVQVLFQTKERKREKKKTTKRDELIQHFLSFCGRKLSRRQVIRQWKQIVPERYCYFMVVLQKVKLDSQKWCRTQWIFAESVRVTRLKSINFIDIFSPRNKFTVKKIYYSNIHYTKQTTHQPNAVCYLCWQFAAQLIRDYFVLIVTAGRKCYGSYKHGIP